MSDIRPTTPLAIYEAQSADLEVMGFMAALDGKSPSPTTSELSAWADSLAMGDRPAIKASMASVLARYNDTNLLRPTRAVCLALGTFTLSDSPDAERAGAQLAAFVRLLNGFGIDKTSVKCHDPRFTSEDIEFLCSLGFDVPGYPEESKADLICDEPTLLFLPFLPFPVYELIFQLNWSPARLKNVVMVAPQLEGWLDDQ